MDARIGMRDATRPYVEAVEFHEQNNTNTARQN